MQKGCPSEARRRQGDSENGEGIPGRSEDSHWGSKPLPPILRPAAGSASLWPVEKLVRAAGLTPRGPRTSHRPTKWPSGTDDWTAKI